MRTKTGTMLQRFLNFGFLNYFPNHDSMTHTMSNDNVTFMISMRLKSLYAWFFLFAPKEHKSHRKKRLWTLIKQWLQLSSTFYLFTYIFYTQWNRKSLLECHGFVCTFGVLYEIYFWSWLNGVSITIWPNIFFILT